jgi:DNA-binding transcriptional regulator YdaS (Cro superfamily)
MVSHVGMTPRITQDAIEKAGGARVVSRHIGLTRQAVSKWQIIPARHVLLVERLSGVSRYDLRPDVFGPPPDPSWRPALESVA